MDRDQHQRSGQSQQGDGLDDPQLKWADPAAKEEARRAGIRGDQLRDLPNARTSGITKDDIKKKTQERQRGGQQR
jgi:hypothetical protein